MKHLPDSELRMKCMITGLAACLLSLGLAGCASTPAASAGPGQLAAQGSVQVAWHDPGSFREVTYGRDLIDTRRGTWIEQLASHLRTQAERRLTPGERLDVTLLDVDRAGEYEPWLGPRYDDVRMMRDIYPPRITLDFRRLDASGGVIDEGRRQLSDVAYLSRAGIDRDNDPLRYEKRLLDDWLRREFKAR